MDAFFVRNRLSAYLDGELSAGEAREVEDALARDAGLREEFEQLKLAVELLHGEGVVDAPPGFAERVRDAVAQERMPSRWTRPLRAVRAEVWLVAAAALLVVGYAGMKQGEPPASTAPSPVDAAKMPTPADDMATEPAAAKEPEAQQEPVAQEERTQSLAQAPKLPTKADGVLGDERPVKRLSEGPLPIPGEMGKTSTRPSKAAPGTEKEPYQAEWEKAPQAGDPDPAATTTDSSTKLFSPAPFQYRLAADDEKVLKQLAELAASLGGKLVDKNGKTIAPYLMEDGDSRSVQIVVPSYNQARLVEKLRALGQVETLMTKDTTLVSPGASVPVAIDVQR